MVTSYRGFTRFNQQRNSQMAVNSSSSSLPTSKTLLEVIKSLDGVSTEIVDRSKTIFFPGDPAERVYLIRRGAVRLSRVYETGEEITVALLRENSLFGVYDQHLGVFHGNFAILPKECVFSPGFEQGDPQIV